MAVILALFTGEAESKSFLKKLRPKKVLKKIEKVGQNVRNAAERGLPTAVGYAGLASQKSPWHLKIPTDPSVQSLYGAAVRTVECC
ncbi:hypothetical protein NQ317_002486 [Molorchus minor]|uniref:Uncharacterized protein n=1 Tax=Molorchus minor TaxID=1323400 RepID=A0ABQ9JA07_9CUCU|nr:hypothetical protein NQ317_002486 [Molorchus minor]